MQGILDVVRRWVVGGMATLVVCGWVGAAETSTEGAAPAAPTLDPGDCLYTLELTNALDGRATLTVYLDRRNMGTVIAFAAGRQFNRMPFDVDASGLKVATVAGPGGSGTVERLAGDMKVTVYSDGYVPQSSVPVVCTYSLEADITGNSLHGSYSGRYGLTAVSNGLSGLLYPRPARSDSARFVLNMENAIGVTEGRKGGGRRATATITMVGGRTAGVRIEPPGSLTDVACALRVEKADLRYAAGRLAGGILVVWTPQSGGDAASYMYSIDAQVIGDNVAGKFTTRLNDKDVEGGRFLGTAKLGRLPEPSEGVWKVTFHDLLGKGKFLDLYLVSRDGRLVDGFGTTPNFNNATHDVDLSALPLAGNALGGGLKVTVNPDPWIPKDHKPVLCSLAIEARAGNGVVSGTYKGTAGETGVEGVLDGVIDPIPVAGAIEGGTLKLEDALSGGNGYGSRAFLTFTAEDGKITGGKLWNNHNKALTGKIEGGALKLDGTGLSGKVTVEVDRGGGVTPGKYEFTVKGCLIGSVGAGTFESSLEGKGAVKSGRYWCSLKMK